MQKPENIEERVESLISRMTLEEKVEQLSGIGNIADPFGDEGCRIFGGRENKRLGIPAWKMGHGPHGMRIGRDSSIKGTEFPVPLALAATWDRRLVYDVAAAVAEELKAKDHFLNLGPTMNIIRNPRGGRTVESYSEDPYLSSRMAVSFVRGTQDRGVAACIKHYACNNQELNRFTVDCIVGERTLREIYLPSFEACIKEAGALSVMASYPKINGIFACQNKRLLTEILKEEWGFEGFVLSDFCGTHSTVEAANSGLDMEMHCSKFFNENLVEAVNRGEVRIDRINDMVRRVLRVKYLTGMTNGGRPPESVIHSSSHICLAKEAAAESLVLLKNEDVLPFDASTVKKIAVLGPFASQTRSEEGSSRVFTFPGAQVSVLEGLKLMLGNGVEILHDESCPPAELAARADAAVVVVELSSMGEGGDRKDNRISTEKVELIRSVSRSNRKTAVLLFAGTSVLMDDWIDDVPALLMMWEPGEQGGLAAAEVLFGERDASGRLPLTFPRSFSQLPPSSHAWDHEITEEFRKLNLSPDEIIEFEKRTSYDEGIFVGYRHFDKYGIEPLFPFGHGLSYTEFEYSRLSLERGSGKTECLRVSFDIMNTGSRPGVEIAQVYVRDCESIVERPVRELKGFERVALKPGEKRRISIALGEESFSFYCELRRRWLMESGLFEIQVGSSSRHIRLHEKIELVPFCNP